MSNSWIWPWTRTYSTLFPSYWDTHIYIYIPDHPAKGGLSSPDEVAISRDDQFTLFFGVLWNIRGLPVENEGGKDYWSKNEHTFGKAVIAFWIQCDWMQSKMNTFSTLSLSLCLLTNRNKGIFYCSGNSRIATLCPE